MEIKAYVRQKVEGARKAAGPLAILSTETKNAALLKMADALVARTEELVSVNARDLDAARKRGLSGALVDRLALDPKRIHAMALGLKEVAGLPDPVGEVVKTVQRPNGMRVEKTRVPIGVIGMVYESRPNVTADAAGLCLKAGNAVVLRGGSEAIHSNSAIARILSESGASAGLPEGCLAFLDNPDRLAVLEMLKLDTLIDLIIPRGGEGLMKIVSENSRIPVIKHDKGLCHTYVDEFADLAMAQAICFNAKVQRPGTCNAMETMLVHKDVATDFLPAMIKAFQEAGVEVRGCSESIRLAPGIQKAVEADWDTEYLDLILSVRVVGDMDEAMKHISRHGSQHSEAIITQDKKQAERFLREVDACAVLVNTSTRLNDGYEFGLGAEIGISTSRIHARGPMGLEDLTTTKYIVRGEGQIRV